MDRRFEVRKQEMLQECQVCPEVLEGIESRLVKFIEPYVELLGQPARQIDIDDRFVLQVSINKPTTQP